MSSPVVPLPSSGDVFVDAGNPEKALRVSWHHDVALVVLSLWRGDTCIGTLRLAPDEVPRLLATLSQGLADAYQAQSTVRLRGGQAS